MKRLLVAFACAAATAFAQDTLVVNPTFLWNATEKGDAKFLARVITGSPDTLSGWWHDFTDNNDGGTSYIQFPAVAENQASFDSESQGLVRPTDGLGLGSVRSKHTREGTHVEVAVGAGREGHAEAHGLGTTGLLLGVHGSCPQQDHGSECNYAFDVH